MEKNNSSLNAKFRFSKFILTNHKLMNEKCQCSQNHDLNPASVPDHIALGKIQFYMIKPQEERIAIYWPVLSDSSNR